MKKTEARTNMEENTKEKDDLNSKEFTEAEISSEGEFSADENAEVEISKKELFDEINEKESEIEALNKEIEDLLNRMQRLQADFINYRKRSEKEKKEMTLKGKIDLTEKFLPILDNFERALNSTDSKDEFFSGVEMIYKQMLNIFEKEGIEEISALGEEFNPEYHEAIMRVEAEKEEEGIIVGVLQKGYKIEDRVIRPAMVKVAC